MLKRNVKSDVPNLVKKKKIARRFIVGVEIVVFAILIDLLISFVANINIFSIITNTYFSGNSESGEVKEIEVHDDTYPQPGSWIVNKTAEWNELNKAVFTYDVKSNVKVGNGYKDIMILVDVSRSMQGEKFDNSVSAFKELTNSLLADSNNRMALVSFASNPYLSYDFTNNKQTMINHIDALYIPEAGNKNWTNYNVGFSKVRDMLRNYTKQNNRELILLFMTDGYPNAGTPNQIATVELLKNEHPYLVINAIQFDLGDKVIKEVDEISDNVWIANSDNLTDKLMEATIAPYHYDNFQIVDYINSSNYNVEGIQSIKVSMGTVSLETENNSPKITWNLGSNYATGMKAKMTIMADLKEEFHTVEGLYPTDTQTMISSKLPLENAKSVPVSPTILKKKIYSVNYEVNTPDGCSLPSIESDYYYELQRAEKKDLTLACSGWIYRGLEIVENDVKRINSDVFYMPDHNVTVRAVWAKPVISKSMDGQIRITYSAYFDEGAVVNRKMKSLAAGESKAETYPDTLIKKILRSNSLPSGFVPQDANTVSSATSRVPIYIWFDRSNGIMYYYSEASGKLFLNENSDSLFRFYRSLTTIDIADLDTSNVVNMGGMFHESNALTSLDLRTFNTSNVKSFSNMFDGCRSLTSINVSSFNTSNAENMAAMFYGCPFSSIDVSNFNTSKVTDMNGMFGETSLTSINLDSFDTSQVRSMEAMFFACSGLTSLDLSKFNTSSVTNTFRMFRGCSNLVTIYASLTGWNMNNVTYSLEMFTGATSIRGGNGTTYNSSYTDKTLAQIDRAGVWGYLTAK